MSRARYSAGAVLTAAVAYAAATVLGDRLAELQGSAPVGLWLPAATGLFLLGALQWRATAGLAVAATLLVLLGGLGAGSAAAGGLGVVIDLGGLLLADRVLARTGWRQPAADARALASPVLALAAVALLVGAAHTAALAATGSLEHGALSSVSLATALGFLVGLLLGAAALEGWGGERGQRADWLRAGCGLALLAGCVGIAQVAPGAWAAAVMVLAWMAVAADLISVVLAAAVLLLGASASSLQGWLPWIAIACVGLISLARFDGRRQRVREEMASLIDARTEALHAELARRRALEVAYRECAHYDELTGLPNRALLRDRLATALADARRNRCGLAVCYFDLDGFAALNASAGRAEGDRALVQLTDRLLPRLRGSDTLARVGGDEFVVVAPHAPNESAAAEVALRILGGFDAPLLENATQPGGELGVSLGVALFPPHGDDADTLLRRAEDAMLEVKRRGKGGWMLYAGQGVVDAPPDSLAEPAGAAPADSAA